MVVASVPSQILVQVTVSTEGFFVTVSALRVFKTNPAPWIVINYVQMAFGMMACFADAVNMDEGPVMLGKVETHSSAPLDSSDAVTMTTATATVN